MTIPLGSTDVSFTRKVLDRVGLEGDGEEQGDKEGVIVLRVVSRGFEWT